MFEASSICSSGIRLLLRKTLYIGFFVLGASSIRSSGTLPQLRKTLYRVCFCVFESSSICSRGIRPRCLETHFMEGFFVFGASSICSNGIQPLLRKTFYSLFVFVFFVCLKPVLFVAVGFGRCLGRHSIEFFCVFQASSICSSGIHPLLRKTLYRGFFCVCLRPVLFVAVEFGRCLRRHSI